MPEENPTPTVNNTVLQGEDILLLPVSVISRIDTGRLTKELEVVDQFLSQMAIRQPGTEIKMPRTSRLFDEITNINKLNVLQSTDRQRLMSFLINVSAKAPTIHISFSSDPSALFTQKLVSWIRSEIYPLALVQIGLQPNMGAGCTVRTTNKYFDFSLRENLKAKKNIFSERMHMEIAPAGPK
jgi:hypothetical protein